MTHSHTQSRGQALLVVLSVLSVVFLVGIAFFYLSHVEYISNLRSLDKLRARYLSEAGVVYGRKILALDKRENLLDTLQDSLYTLTQGADADVDQDGTAESRWFSVADTEDNFFGRFAIAITDESSKLNLNTADSSSLEQLFSALQLPSNKLDSILALKPIHAIEQLSQVLSREEFALAKRYLTVYSRDQETDVQRRLRTYYNSAHAPHVAEGFLNRGVSNCFKNAANLKDAADEDLAQTLIDSFVSGAFAPTALTVAGGWQKIGNIYQASAGTQKGTFTWSNLPVADGQYYCFLYGAFDSEAVGKVEIPSQGYAQTILSGEGLVQKVTVQEGSLSFAITPLPDALSRFSHIELISSVPAAGFTRKIVSGTEALVINEIMVKPSRVLSIDPVELIPGQSYIHTFQAYVPGIYHLVLKAAVAGATVGDVTIGSERGNGLKDGDYFPLTVEVDIQGKLVVEIKNNTLSNSSFAGIGLLQEPDAEYIEVLNISPQEIDISNFVLEVYSLQGDLVVGWPARIPEGTTIRPYQHLVCVVDNSDVFPTPVRLRNNRIYFQKVWGFNTVGLIFDDYADTIDCLFDLIPNNGGKVFLKDTAGIKVDGVSYTAAKVQDFVSIERADPSAQDDADNDGLFDGWYFSGSVDQATPGTSNENTGMYILDEATGMPVKQSLNQVTVFNRALVDTQEILKLSNGKSWKKFEIRDIVRLCDRFSFYVEERALKSHYLTGDFKEQGGGYVSEDKYDSGIWEFSDIPEGNYLLSIISDDPLLSSGRIRVSVQVNVPAEEDFTDFSQLLFYGGIAWYGEVPCGATPSVLRIKIINDANVALSLTGIRLEPDNSVEGRINVNTASGEVLESLFTSARLAQDIISSRPLGLHDAAELGLGDLFRINPDGVNFGNMLTVKSDIYEIQSRGEYTFNNPPVTPFETIRSVIERGE
ncbi:MAG: general secretion pathway protein GspK [Candidatus Omnitrophica bacterium]|nr:general secretion pathway protein GspK [Candidatus Omnitrophota bacterium]